MCEPIEESTMTMINTTTKSLQNKTHRSVMPTRKVPFTLATSGAPRGTRIGYSLVLHSRSQRVAPTSSLLM